MEAVTKKWVPAVSAPINSVGAYQRWWPAVFTLVSLRTVPEERSETVIVLQPSLWFSVILQVFPLCS